MSEYNPFSLAGKTVLITGASSGIGRASAIECAKMGARVVVAGRNAERLQATYAQLEGEGHVQFLGDLVEQSAIEALCAQTPALDGVLLCAGIADTTLVKFITAEKFQKVLDINLISPTVLLRHLVGAKKINKGASIVFVSSVGAYKHVPALALYAASKAGLNAVTRATAVELSGRGVRANAILPGMVQTELVDNLAELSQEDLLKDMQNYPLGYGRPMDVAGAVVYLFSDVSRWVTGIEMVLDGGYSLKN